MCATRVKHGLHPKTSCNALEQRICPAVSIGSIPILSTPRWLIATRLLASKYLTSSSSSDFSLTLPSLSAWPFLQNVGLRPSSVQASFYQNAFGLCSRLPTFGEFESALPLIGAEDERQTCRSSRRKSRSCARTPTTVSTLFQMAATRSC